MNCRPLFCAPWQSPGPPPWSLQSLLLQAQRRESGELDLGAPPPPRAPRVPALGAPAQGLTSNRPPPARRAGADVDPCGRGGFFEVAATSKCARSPHPCPARCFPRPLLSRPQAKLLVRPAAPRFPRALLRGPSSPASPPPRVGGGALVGMPASRAQASRDIHPGGAHASGLPATPSHPATRSSGAGKEAATGGLEPGARRTARLTLNIDSAASFTHQRQAGGRGRGRRTSLGRRLFTPRKEPLKLK